MKKPLPSEIISSSLKVLSYFVLLCFLFFSSRLNAEGKELILPIVANGQNSDSFFQTTIVVTSQSTTGDSALIVGVPDDPGGKARLFCPPFIITLPPYDLETTRRGQLPPGGNLALLSSGESPDLFNGWIRLTTDRIDSVTVSAELSIVSGTPLPCHEDGENIPRTDIANRGSQQILTSVALPAVETARQWQASVTVSRERESALALVNPGDKLAEVTVRLLDNEGTVVENGSSVAEYTLLLEPMERISTFVWRLAFAPSDFTLPPGTIGVPPPPGPPPKPDLFRGSMQIESSVPIAVGGVDVLFPEGKYVGLAVIATQQEN